MARAASNVLSGKGWHNQEVLEEGLPGWWEKGYPVAGTDTRTTPRH